MRLNAQSPLPECAARRVFDPVRMTVVVAGTVGGPPVDRIAAKPEKPATHH